MPVTRFYFLLFLLIGIYPAFLHAQEVKSIEEHTPDSSMSQKGKAFIKEALQDSLKKQGRVCGAGWALRRALNLKYL